MDSTKYIIIAAAELDSVDFQQTNESALETLRFSNDGSKTFISWNEEAPSFIDGLSSKSEIYSEAEILEIMETSDWKKILY